MCYRLPAYCYTLTYIIIITFSPKIDQSGAIIVLTSAAKLRPFKTVLTTIPTARSKPRSPRSPLFRVPTCPSFPLVHRRNLIVRTKKKSDNFVREVRVFKFEHRAKRKTRTWKTRTIWSEKSEFLTWPATLLCYRLLQQTEYRFLQYTFY